MKIVAIVQARMGSTRLPGKVLMNVAGEPMLARVINRLHKAKSLDQIVVATSQLSADDEINEICQQRDWNCFRGSEDDVLDRYWGAAQQFKADVIVRITSDCPLIDASVVDRVVDCLATPQSIVSYAANTLEPRTFPRGLDVEAFTFRALEEVWQSDRNPASREHVTPYFYRHPEQFLLRTVQHEKDLSRYRWTVDTNEDLEFVRRIYQLLNADYFGWEEVLDLVTAYPELTEINRSIEQKKVPS